MSVCSTVCYLKYYCCLSLFWIRLGALVGLDVRDFEVHGFWKGLFWISSSVAMACK